MKDIYRQMGRAFKNTNTYIALYLVFYALYFAHTDTPVFYQQPIVFFKSTNFYYFFIIAFYMGVTRFLVPIAAVLPLGFFLCDDTDSGYLNLALYRGSGLGYGFKRLAAVILSAVITVLAACILMTVLLLLLSTLEGGETESWLLYSKGTAFESIMKPGSFWKYVLIQHGHQALSAAIWASVAVGLSALWPNKAFVFVATFGLSLFMDAWVGKVMGDEYTLGWLQNPEVHTHVPIYLHFVRQGMYLLAALIFSGGALLFRFSTAMRRVKQPIQLWLKRHIAYDRSSSQWHLPGRWQGTAMGRILTDARSFCTFKTLVPAAIVPLLVMYLGNTLQSTVYSIGDLWLEVFSGFGWFDPVINFHPIGKWTLMLLPPMMGIALNLDRELRLRLPVTLHRFNSKQAWWVSKCVSCMLYALVCILVMFASVAVFGFLSGARGLAVYMPDADGFMVENYMILLQLFALLFAQILMLTQLQALVHLVSGRMQIGILAYALPLIVCLISYSIFDRPINKHIPYNWGMLMRTTIFSPSDMPVEEGGFIELCAIPYHLALIKQLIVLLVLSPLNMLVIRAINIAQREVKA